MSDPAAEEGKCEAKVQENIGQAVGEVKDLDFATLEEMKEAFRN